MQFCEMTLRQMVLMALADLGGMRSRAFQRSSSRVITVLFAHSECPRNPVQAYPDLVGDRLRVVRHLGLRFLR